MSNSRRSMAAVVAIIACLSLVVALRSMDEKPQSVKVNRPVTIDPESVSDVPRYRFLVGDAYVYEALSKFDYDGGTMTNTDRDDVWVIRQNGDGSFRLVIRHTSQYKQERDDGDPYEGEERVALSYCDMFPDGRFERNPSLGYQVNPSSIFPRLPAEAGDLATGWQSESNSFLGDTTFEVIEHPDDPQGVWTVKYVLSSPMDAIYESTASGESKFDGEKGLTTSFTTSRTQGYGFTGEGRGTITLVSADTVTDDWLTTFLTETDAYFDASSEYTRLLQEANDDYGQAEDFLTKARAVLEQTLSETTLATVTDQLQKQLQQHEQSASYTLDNAKKFAKLIGQPSEDWNLQDLDGTQHSLSDYRGQVVLLDFWYRGCGWCIRAMPQIKQVADAFADRPVTVLGMNTDQEIEDAHFVVDAMGLNYNNLQATGIPEKYGVTGFPTLVILDQQGTVRDIHVGYADDLIDQISATIERLLAESSHENSGAEEETEL